MGRDLNAVKNDNAMNWNNHFHHRTDQAWSKLKKLNPPPPSNDPELKD